ncbi:MAG: DsbA family oxidoreductase [Gemmatimonadetes bacterium]|nr:MAG: DsbA family oxidoreductase [Gemmatimonadota bacterium]
MRVDIYSDVACPWCYIGQARFERALDDFPGKEHIEVRYRPYQLDPRAPMSAEPMYDYLERRFGARGRSMASHVIGIARGEGLEMDYDRGLSVNTLNAHRLLMLADREHGAAIQRALMRRLFDAHFSEGKDVGDPRVLAELAADVGMDPDPVRNYLETDEGAGEVHEAIAAAQRLGVSAVPSYVFDDKYLVEGAQPTELFLQALHTMAEEAAATDVGR